MLDFWQSQYISMHSPMFSSPAMLVHMKSCVWDEDPQMRSEVMRVLVMTTNLLALENLTMVFAEAEIQLIL